MSLIGEKFYATNEDATAYAYIDMGFLSFDTMPRKSGMAETVDEMNKLLIRLERAKQKSIHIVKGMIVRWKETTARNNGLTQSTVDKYERELTMLTNTTIKVVKTTTVEV